MNQENIIRCEIGQRLWDIFEGKCKAEDLFADAWMHYIVHAFLCPICSGCSENLKKEDYYTEEEVEDIIDDFDKLRDYLYGWDDAIETRLFYKKKYVNMYKNR